MPLLKDVATPTGAMLGYHVVAAIAADLQSEQAKVLLTVRSWPTEEIYVAAAGKMAAWERICPLPRSAFEVNTGDMMAIAEECLQLVETDLHPFSGASRVPFVNDLDGAKARRRAYIDAEREARLVAPLEYDGSTFDGDTKSQRNIQGWQTQIANGVELPAGFVWRDANNVDHPADAAYVNGLGEALTARGTAVYRQSWALKAAVDLAKRLADVQEVVWPA